MRDCACIYAALALNSCVGDGRCGDECSVSSCASASLTGCPV